MIFKFRKIFANLVFMLEYKQRYIRNSENNFPLAR